MIAGLGSSTDRHRNALARDVPSAAGRPSESQLHAQEQPEVMTRVVRSSPRRIRGGWRYIYIHHSKTAEGDVRTLAQPEKGLGDHFLIGNGGRGSPTATFR